jgi:hypothetical protein
MSSVEELIRTKLKEKLAEEKRRIAAELIVEASTPGMAKQSKSKQISVMQQKIQAAQSKGNKSPEMTKSLAVMKDKLTLMKAELGQMN